jgi:hypothetical protein
MYLAQRITTFNIHYDHAILPVHRYEPAFEPILEHHTLDEKQRLLRRFEEIANRIASWKPVGSPEQLGEISRDSLTRLVSAAEGLWHIQRDTLLNRADNAKQ